MFLRRIGTGPHTNGAHCSGTGGCPDIWELENGDYAIIGADITTAVMANLPPSAGCAANERIVRLPRQLLVSAKRDIPDGI
jgi:hypothetical protein